MRALWFIVLLAGCTSSQKIINVVCEQDATLQPIIVPVVIVASPLTGPAAPAVAAVGSLDMLLIHPGVVAACDAYSAKPATLVSAVPAGVIVAKPIVVEGKIP